MIPSWAGQVRGRWSQARQRVRSWLQGSPAGLVAVALAVGVGAGAGAVVFRYLILWCTRLFTGHADYAGAGHAANPWFPQLGFWFVVFAPVLGGLVYGPLVEFFAREARGHGVPEVMLAVAKHGGRIRPQVAAIKSLASAICIGSGGSVGREGPIVQIGSALGSTLGQVLGLVRRTAPTPRGVRRRGGNLGHASTRRSPASCSPSSSSSGTSRLRPSARSCWHRSPPASSGARRSARRLSSRSRPSRCLAVGLRGLRRSRTGGGARRRRLHPHTLWPRGSC